MGDGFNIIMIILILFGFLLIIKGMDSRIKKLENKINVLWEYSENFKNVFTNFQSLADNMKKLAEVQAVILKAYAELYAELHPEMQKEDLTFDDMWKNIKDDIDERYSCKYAKDLPDAKGQIAIGIVEHISETDNRSAEYLWIAETKKWELANVTK